MLVIRSLQAMQLVGPPDGMEHGRMGRKKNGWYCGTDVFSSTIDCYNFV